MNQLSLFLVTYICTENLFVQRARLTLIMPLLFRVLLQKTYIVLLYLSNYYNILLQRPSMPLLFPGILYTRETCTIAIKVAMDGQMCDIAVFSQTFQECRIELNAVR